MNTKFEPTKLEPEVLEFWSKKKIYQKLKKKAAKAPKYFFLDGPPYTTGAFHVGGAWNYSLKDCFRRYLWMSGYDVNDTPGFDTHGLPIEHKVEVKLGIKNKNEIVEKIGVANFIRECEKFAYDNMYPMIKDFQRLGVWMNWENPYMTLKKEYLEGAWWSLKQAWKNGYLYQGLKVTTWCPRCATSLAKHELEYEKLKDNSIYLKFKLVGKQNEYLLVWTTTPWTIPYNLAVMVHPDFDYAKVKSGTEVWIIAKDLVEKVFGMLGKEYEILEIVKGKELEGVQYVHPLAEKVPALKELSNLRWAHRVVPSDKYVTTVDGTGLVHCAPGCGPEDFEVGQKYGLPGFNELNENGYFSEKMGAYNGWRARADDAKFIEDFDVLGMLVHTQKYEHEYAQCWRCHTDVVYKATKQWFLARTKLKDLMLKENANVYWTPDWAGQKWFESWLENLEDWNISRQRFWGIPLPIWICSSCKDMLVAESADELKKLGGKIPKDLHKPWIDDVVLKCRKCKSEMRRVPDVLDVWLDSGAAPWSSTGDKDVVAEYISEGKDQIRGWFNSLMSLSIVARKKAPYKSVFMHGFILDAQGRKMSKSLGNVISPYEVFDRYGADAFRFYVIGGSKPGLDLNYNFADVEVKLANLNVLWNTHAYLVDSAGLAGANPAKLKAGEFSTEDKYMLSRLNHTIHAATDAFKKHHINEVPWIVESLFLELSRWYIKTVRDKVENENVLYVIYKVLLESVRLMAPITPFISEKIYQNLREAFGLKDESVHLLGWPAEDEKQIDEKLEEEMEHVKVATSYVMAARDKLQRGVKWPIKKAFLVTADEKFSSAVRRYADLIKSLTNVAELSVQAEEPKGISRTVKADYHKIEAKFGKSSPEVIAKIVQMSPESILSKVEKSGKYVFTLSNGEQAELARDELTIQRAMPENLFLLEAGGVSIYLDKNENDVMLASGFAREFVRGVQALRKKAGLQRPDKIGLAVSASGRVQTYLKENLEEIRQKVGAKSVLFATASEIKKKKFPDKLDVRGELIEFGL